MTRDVKYYSNYFYNLPVTPLSYKSPQRLSVSQRQILMGIFLKKNKQEKLGEINWVRPVAALTRISTAAPFSVDIAVFGVINGTTS